MTQARRACAALPSTQSSRVAVTISMIVAMPRPGSPISQAVAPVVLDLGGGVRPVPQLVLQALDAQRVPAAVGQHARQQEARQALGCLREDQEQVAHRRRAEPLMAGQQVAARFRQGGGAGGVGPDIRAPLLLRHPSILRPAAPAFLRRGPPSARLVDGRGEPPLIPGGQRGLVHAARARSRRSCFSETGQPWPASRPGSRRRTWPPGPRARRAGDPPRAGGLQAVADSDAPSSAR